MLKNLTQLLIDKGILLQPLPRPFSHQEGNCWEVVMPELSPLADLEGARQRSPLSLYEDGVPLLPAHALHDDIRRIGGGLYSHWTDRLKFSTSDNSDPNTNGRTYKFSLSPRRLKGYTRSPVNAPCLPVNHRPRDASPEQIRRDVEYTLSAIRTYARVIRELLRSLAGKRVLEVGPGVNYGGVMYLAAYGMRPMVADRFLAPWQDEYHTAFYAALRDEVARRDPRADVRPLHALVKARGYPRRVLARYEAPLEEIPVATGSVDVVFSNAVLEHVGDLETAFAQLYRITRPGGINLHQIDFRDHRDFDRPLECLLMSEPDFQELFARCHGEYGNRRRPEEVAAWIRAAGFEALGFEANHFSKPEYLEDFLPRLRAASTSPYREHPAEDLHVLSGDYWLRKPARRSGRAAAGGALAKRGLLTALAARVLRLWGRPGRGAAEGERGVPG